MSVTFLDEDGVARLRGTILGIAPGGNLASTLAAGNDAMGQAIAGLADPSNPQDADTLAARAAAIVLVLQDPRFPTTDEKAALVGTAGTPSAADPYVTDADTRMTNARTPLTHSHAESDVTGLAGDLAGKAATVHTHAESDVTSLVSDLAGKAAASHTHTESDITGLITGLAGKEDVSPVAWTTVVKPGDQSNSTAVSANDNDLFFATVNGAVYEFQLVIVYASPAGGATPDLKTIVGEDNTDRGVYAGWGFNTTDTVGSVASLVNTGVVQSWGTATTNRPVSLRGSFIAGGGTFRLKWAQVTSNANPVIVRAGSLLRYRRIV